MDIDLGEAIHIRSVIKPKCAAEGGQEIPFTIRDARFELYCGSELENKGDCSINGHEIDAFVSPLKTGTYYLKYIYEIADETWVDKIKLKVR